MCVCVHTRVCSKNPEVMYMYLYVCVSAHVCNARPCLDDWVLLNVRYSACVHALSAHVGVCVFVCVCARECCVSVHFSSTSSGFKSSCSL